MDLTNSQNTSTFYTYRTTKTWLSSKDISVTAIGRRPEGYSANHVLIIYRLRYDEK